MSEIDLEVLAQLQKAIVSGKDLESLGLQITSEILDAYNQLAEEYSNAPAGSTPFIVEDLEWGMSDALLRATERAVGPMFGDRPLDELYAERKRELGLEQNDGESGD